MSRYSENVQRLLFTGFQCRGIVGSMADYLVQDLPLPQVEKTRLVAKITAMPGTDGLEKLASIYAEHGWPNRPPITTKPDGTKVVGWNGPNE